MSALDATLLRFALGEAVRAPSSHNSQPWKFRVAGCAVEVWADRTRQLPVVDPDGREMIISCGAAVEHLCIALAHHGVRTEVETCIEGDRLARVRMVEHGEPTDDDHALYGAIANRHTNRGPFARRAVPREVIVQLRDAAEIDGVWLAPMQDHERRHELATLIAEADREQWANPAFRKELAAWVRPNHAREPDGMPGYAIGIESDLLARLGPIVVRTFDRGDGEAARDSELAEGAPLLAVLGSAHDEPKSWLFAGRALSRVLLRATTLGLSASFLNQPIEVPSLRAAVSAIVGIDGAAQLILRLGYGDPPAHVTPRRAVEDVLL
jgi:nitroreductase